VSTVPDLLFLLSRASHVLSTEMTAGLEGLGISPRAHCVLSKAMAGGLTQKQLADICDLDKTTMVVTIDELEHKGFAVRRPSPEDRRARIIEVTDDGARLVGEAQEVVERIHADVLAALPDGARDAFVEGLTSLTDGRLAQAVACERPVRRSRGN
jgi:MarR family transcriptional regulator, transcriptional regulator for hemolysin